MKKRRATVVPITQLRFVNAVSQLEALLPHERVRVPGVVRPPRVPTIHVDIVRPADLIALSVDAVGCELLSDGAKPAHLRPLAKQKSAYLVVRYAFQHVGEEAIYEGQSGKNLVYDESDPTKKPKIEANSGFPTTANERHVPPILARAAGATRLVFDIPAGETIEFSSAGILEAMTRLRPRVHDLATPGEVPTRDTAGISANPPVVVITPGKWIVDGLEVVVKADAVVVKKASKQDVLAHGRASDRTPAGLLSQVTDRRRVRTLLQSRTGVVKGSASLRDSLILGGGVAKHVEPARPKLVPKPPGDIHLVGPAKHSRPPAADETAIEAPYRLIISPSTEARWVHALEPVVADDAAEHVELWHSRLGNLGTRVDGSTFVDERSTSRRIVRAVWTRDRDQMAKADWQETARNLPKHTDNPFRMSLDPADRQMLVQQSSETIRTPTQLVAPLPVAAHALWLSALGAWLDLHGAWDSKPYSNGSLRSILAWDHLAPMGRDQYVRVVYPGYLYPWGHQAALVKVTERKMKDASPSTAGLFQRKFLVIGEPRRVYADRHELPFTEVSIRPIMTPPLDEPSGGKGDDQDTFFWPKIAKEYFKFVVDALDHESRPVRLQMPLLWVAEHYHGFDAVDTAYRESKAQRVVAAHGQAIAFAPPHRSGDTQLATATLRFLGAAALGASTPRMSSAEVRVPAVETLSPLGGPLPIAYHDIYRASGLAKQSNAGEVWARTLLSGSPGQASDDPTMGLPLLGFGEGASSGSERAGGFLTPSVPIRGLSRLVGVVGDPTNVAKQQFNPEDFFAGAMPKLFGLIPLFELVKQGTKLLHMPKIVSEFVGRIEGLITEVERATQAIEDAVAEAKAMELSAEAKVGEIRDQWVAKAQVVLAAANSAQALFNDLNTRLGTLMNAASSGGALATVKTIAEQFANLVDQAVNSMQTLADQLPAFMGSRLRTYAQSLKSLVGDVPSLIADLVGFISGLAEAGSQGTIRYEWTPTVASWPEENHPLIRLKPDSLRLAIKVQTGRKGGQSSEVLAELRDFTLHLFRKEELLSLKFTRFAFVADGKGKPQVDIVIDEIGFHGVLSFVNDLKKLIPLDGFSDPPAVDITPEGLSAGFSVALPNLAVGVFSISNLSLGADVQVPFLGKAMTVGFNFCTRERPFVLAVAFIGGGGWCGIRVSAQGLDVLEVSLEAGAYLGVDLGVASGSISVMLGVYIRIEGEGGSITGYFRMRGEVDVLGLISAAIELYMSLDYEPPTGKLVGEASITISVSVIGISKTVRISARRTFAGSNGDPSFLEVMGAESGKSPAWDTYCAAFIGEK
ncbi:MAG: methyl-accepting chemotaxis protein [Rhodanobacter sp.]